MKKVGLVTVAVMCLFTNEIRINYYLKHDEKIIGHPTYYVYEEAFKDPTIVNDNDRLKKMIIYANNWVLTKNS